MLAPLPVEALRLEPKACAVLRQLGFRRVGQLLELPRGALARRLGEDALDRLDEALGRRPAPLELSLEPPSFRAERRLFEPISEAEQVMQVARDLAGELCASLEGRGLGGRRFALELFRVDGAVKRLDVCASRPLRSPPHVAALFAERLAGLDEGLQADFGFDQLRLTALRTQPVDAAATDLLSQALVPGAVEALADRLAARGGAPAHRLAPADRHTPEAAETPVPLDARAHWGPVGDAPRYLDTPLRPLRLFRPPQPIEVPLAGLPEGPPARFTWRRVTRTVVRAEGPERLEPEWAREPTVAGVRDYYRLEDEAGRRYWVFRQGRYDIADAPPAPPPPREEIKPVRPPPKPERRLKLVHPAPDADESSPPPRWEMGRGGGARTAAELMSAGGASPCLPQTSCAHPHSCPSPIKGEGKPYAEAPPPEDSDNAPPASPAWFLHGLFG